MNGSHEREGFEPLHLKANDPQNAGRSPKTVGTGQTISTWLRQCLNVWQPAKLSTARIQIQEQIAGRHAFPIDEWQLTKLPIGLVSEVLRLLARRMKWPNSNFLPCDPIQLVFLEEYDEFAPNEFFLDLRDRFGVALTKIEIEQLCRGGQTVEQFIRNVTFKLP